MIHIDIKKLGKFPAPARCINTTQAVIKKARSALI
jgi:hypothetical protein